MRDGSKRLFGGTVHATSKDYYNGPKREVSEISVEEMHRLLQKADQIVLLDVREKEEIALGYIKGAVFIPRGLLKEKAQALLPEEEVPVIACCAAGV